MCKTPTIWLTGVPCSGKSTIAALLGPALISCGLRVQVLDSDVVRPRLSPALGFSAGDRDAHISRLGYVCELFAGQGIVTVVAAVSPYAAARDALRELLDEFVEVYVSCPIPTAARRDVRGLYKKAMAGEIKNFTGISDRYEEPKHPDIVVETHKQTPGESVAHILSQLKILEG